MSNRGAIYRLGDAAGRPPEVVVERGGPSGINGYRVVQFQCRGCGEVHRSVYYPPYPETYSDECGECWDLGRRDRIERGRNV